MLVNILVGHHTYNTSFMLQAGLQRARFFTEAFDPLPIIIQASSQRHPTHLIGGIHAFSQRHPTHRIRGIQASFQRHPSLLSDASEPFIKGIRPCYQRHPTLLLNASNASPPRHPNLFSEAPGARSRLCTNAKTIAYQSALVGHEHQGSLTDGWPRIQTR